MIDYLLLQTHGPLVNTSFFWNLSDLYIDFAVIFLLLACIGVGGTHCNDGDLGHPRAVSLPAGK